MLGDITVADEIYVICGYTDMRKSIDGLCALIQDQLKMDPGKSRAIYLFCGKRNDRIKVLLHESDGYVLLYKRYNKQEYGTHTRNDFKCILRRRISRATCMDVTYSIHQNDIQHH